MPTCVDLLAVFHKPTYECGNSVLIQQLGIFWQNYTENFQSEIYKDFEDKNPKIKM